ncbi:phage tail tape measure protein [Paenibacillus sp. KQZ6P-2]|uniref:Phage tail tape measure protein n=1 Tax=Paenibacillus mangrovi TaxID=2931978 RepID=A0A9X2B508_9BACL|nr:phage tail tape measure protein [Paenibacillus mangrovi]MCJ8015224.1 phage tail tape measure protein [Paenibacillus mangrovi]
MAGGIIGNLMFAVGFKVGTSALSRAQKQMDSLQNKVVAFGAAAGIALGGFAMAATGAAASFEKSMSHVQMATGATNEQMEATKAIATDLYSQNFGENWSDLSQAITTTAQITGQQGDALKQTTQDALLLRDAFGFEVVESVKTSDTMMKQFGITSDQAMSLLAQGAQNGLDKSGDLMDTANEYANQFKSLGFNANEMFDTLAAGSQNGAFNLDKVGDAVKEFNIRSKDGSKTTIQAFEMLGLNADKMMNTFASGGPQAKQAFQQIMQMIGDIEDPVQRNAIGVALMGSQFEDLEAKTITAMGSVRSQFDMTKDSMGQLNQIKFNTPGEAAARIGRQLQTNLLIPIGEKLLPYLTKFSQWLEKSGPQLQQVGGALVDGLAKGISTVSDSFKFLADNIDVIVPALGGFAVVIGIKLIPVIKAMTQAQWAAARASWAVIAPWLPIIGIALLVAAAIAGVILVFKNWGAVSTWLVNVWNSFKTWVVNIFNSIVEFFRTWGATILSVLIAPVIWVVSMITNCWGQVRSITVSVFSGIWNSMKAIWTGIVNSVSTSVTSIWTKITTIWNQITGFLKGINLFDIGKNIIEGLVNGIGSMANAVVDKVKEIGNSITDKVKSILGIHSPSRVMMELGFYTGEGLARGIDGTQDRVSAASSGLADEIVAAPSTSPAKALPPARVAAGQTTGEMDIKVNIDLRADASSATVAADVSQEVRAVLQQVIDEAMRRMGLQAPEVVQ